MIVLIFPPFILALRKLFGIIIAYLLLSIQTCSTCIASNVYTMANPKETHRHKFTFLLIFFFFDFVFMLENDRFFFCLLFGFIIFFFFKKYVHRYLFYFFRFLPGAFLYNRNRSSTFSGEEKKEKEAES